MVQMSQDASMGTRLGYSGSQVVESRDIAKYPGELYCQINKVKHGRYEVQWIYSLRTYGSYADRIKMNIVLRAILV